MGILGEAQEQTKGQGIKFPTKFSKVTRGVTSKPSFKEAYLWTKEASKRLHEIWVGADHSKKNCQR